MVGESVPSPDREASVPLTGMTEEMRFGTDEGTWVSVDVTPEGGTVVFDLLGDLYAMPIGGGAVTRLTHGLPFDSQPRVSPDGRWIAFVSDRGGADNLWVMDRAGGYLRQLSDNEHSVSISPTWSPDGGELLVAECLSYLTEARFRWYPAGRPATSWTRSRPRSAAPAAWCLRTAATSTSPDATRWTSCAT